MILKPRPYQLELIEGISSAFMEHRRVIMSSPTGSGKTVTFSKITKKTIKNGKRVMILCHRTELIEQAYDKLRTYGLMPTIIQSNRNFSFNNCYVASVDTLYRWDNLPAIDLLIVDEAHLTTFDKILDRYPNTYTIGATATPFRKSEAKSLHLRYGTIVESVDIPTLIEQNYLSSARYYGAKQDLGKLEKRGGDFKQEQLYDLFNQSKMYDGLVDKYNKFCNEGKTIIFNVNIEHSVQTTQALRDAGIQAAHIDGKTPGWKRKQILNDFKLGYIQALNNCGVLTTGYDEPSIKNVVLNRATDSLPLYLQMTGRGSRLYDDNMFNVLDMGSNIYRHGFWCDKREWNLEYKRKRKSDQTAPVKTCKCCEAIINASARVCKYCQTVQPIKEKKLKQSEFVEFKKNKIPDRLKKPFREMTNPELQEFAELSGYKQGWVYTQMKLRDKGRPRFVQRKI